MKAHTKSSPLRHIFSRIFAVPHFNEREREQQNQMTQLNHSMVWPPRPASRAKTNFRIRKKKRERERLFLSCHPLERLVEHIRQSIFKFAVMVKTDIYAKVLYGSASWIHAKPIANM
jgi:hypothetical protein